MNKFKKIISSILVCFSLFVSLTSCSSLMGNTNAGLMIGKIGAKNLDNGDTELTIYFTDEDEEPVTFLIPKGKVGDKGEQGDKGVGIKTITQKDSEDGLSSIITISYTDEAIDNTYLKVNHGVSVVDIKSIVNVEKNVTEITYLFSDGSNKMVSVPNGKDGIGIESVTSKPGENGKDYVVTITYTGGKEPSTITLPYKNGEDGRGISRIVGNHDTINNEYTISITYTDGSVEDLVPIKLPTINTWRSGPRQPNKTDAKIANEGDFFFNTKDAIIYAFSQGVYNEVIDLKKDNTPSETYKVTFDPNGGDFIGSLPNTITVIAGRPIQMNRIPKCEKEGMTFIGYYSTIEGPNNPLSGKLDDLTPIYGDVTFYAQYK